MSAIFPDPLATALYQGRRDGLLGIVAHQGGWDELLLVAGPIVVIIAVLAVAKRRVDAIDATHSTADEHAAPEER